MTRLTFLRSLLKLVLANPLNQKAMRKITLLFIAVLILAVSSLNAQSPTRVCGTMDYLKKQIAADPSVKDRMDALENYVDNWVRNNPNHVAKSVIAIPVVVHIIYNGTAQNITDARVQEQIAASNTDYAGANAHSMQAFASNLKANTGIQFCLAQRDPSGNATTGIERRSTTHSNFGAANDDERHTSKGGLDAWDVTKYFNIWVCDLGTSLCGYSQFPYSSEGGGVNSNYGSTINYIYFGIIGASAPYNLGGTLTHEMGHCNDLYHTWGDDNGACTGTDNCGDTPNQANYTYGTHTGVLTDACTTTSPGIMYTNFMDYSDDICYANFTPNQVTRIQALYAVGGPLYSLTTSNGCVAPTPSACGTATTLTATTITTTTATLGWAAVTGATSYNVQYRVTGTTTWTSKTSTTNSLAITGLTAATNYEFQVQVVCSSGTGNYTSSYTFTTLSATTGCTDNYESNNTAATAKTIPVNTAISALIGTSTDLDYYKITNTSTQKNIKITLTNLPYDYDLRLYKSNGTSLLYTSQNSSTTSETIIYDNAPVATYIIEVYGYKSAYSATSCYTLTANISSSTYKESAPDNIATETQNNMVIFPVPAKDNATLSYSSDRDCNVTVRVIDITGKVVTSNNYTAVKGSNAYNLSLSGINKGLYIVELISNNDVLVKKLMVDK